MPLSVGNLTLTFISKTSCDNSVAVKEQPFSWCHF